MHLATPLYVQSVLFAQYVQFAVAMHEAAALGRMDALHWLVAARANATLRNRESRTPAEVAP